MRSIAATLVFTLAWANGGFASTRLKELATIEGVRDNQLVGYGLVVGLAGTGDRRQTIFSAQTLANMLERMGVSVNPTAMQVANTAAVMVTATLPPYAQPGSRIDIAVSAIGDCKSLQGGTLILTPLKAADGQVFAVGQGPLILGGLQAGGGGSSTTVNHPTSGRILAGAIVEKALPGPKPDQTALRLQLRRPDFTTAARIAETINKEIGKTGVILARAENAGLIVVTQPVAFNNRHVEFVAAVESLRVDADHASRVIINERTGTITMGSDIEISPVTILHGALSVQIQTTFEVSQPNPMAPGETKVVPTQTVSAKEDLAKNVTLKKGATVEDLVKSLLAIGSTPRDIVAVLDALKAAGALDASVEVI